MCTGISDQENKSWAIPDEKEDEIRTLTIVKLSIVPLLGILESIATQQRGQQHTFGTTCRDFHRVLLGRTGVLNVNNIYTLEAIYQPLPSPFHSFQSLSTCRWAHLTAARAAWGPPGNLRSFIVSAMSMNGVTNRVPGPPYSECRKVLNIYPGYQKHDYWLAINREVFDLASG